MSEYCIIMPYYDIKIEDVTDESHATYGSFMSGYWIVILGYDT